MRQRAIRGALDARRGAAVCTDRPAEPRPATASSAVFVARPARTLGDWVTVNSSTAAVHGSFAYVDRSARARMPYGVSPAKRMTATISSTVGGSAG